MALHGNKGRLFGAQQHEWSCGVGLSYNAGLITPSVRGSRQLHDKSQCTQQKNELQARNVTTAIGSPNYFVTQVHRNNTGT